MEQPLVSLLELLSDISTHLQLLHYPHSEPEDYLERTIDLAFSAAVDRVCTDITIVNDTTFEDNETIIVTITTTDPETMLDPDDGVVTIVDEDGMCERCMS